MLDIQKVKKKYKTPKQIVYGLIRGDNFNEPAAHIELP